jgi:hypothetical protein
LPYFPRPRLTRESIESMNKHQRDNRQGVSFSIQITHEPSYRRLTSASKS